MPATETDFEREFAELVARLRDVDAAAPESLRARVRALGEPDAPATLRDRWTAIRWRRALLVAAPACLAALLSVAVARGLLSSRGGPPTEAAATSTVAGAERTPPNAKVPAPTWGALAPRAPGSTVLSPQVHGGTAGRPVDYDATLRVRVPDLDALTDRTTEAMQIVRSLGGYVASVQQTTTAGQPGEADLALRVPVGNVETALMRLSGLGTVLDQHLSIVDLKQTLDQQRQRIRSLRYQIARLQEALRNPSLPADVRLRLQFQLEAARQSLGRLTGAHKDTLRQAALSDVSLALTTPRTAGAATKHDGGRAERAARDAAAFLAAAGAVALFVLIAVSPLALIVAAWIYGSRAYRRREDRRLLAPASE